jgi:hypothetical protein
LRPEELLNRLTTEVREFRCANFVLESDPHNLIRTLNIKAPDAVIVYCPHSGNIVERSALAELSVAISDSVYSNLEVLRQFDLFSPSVSQWANALRRLGNDVRHVHYSIRITDAELACLLLERCLEWFFCSFPLRPRVPFLTRDGIAWH